jgi:hypothetical protein
MPMITAEKRLKSCFLVNENRKWPTRDLVKCGQWTTYRRHIAAYAHACTRMLTHAHVCSRMRALPPGAARKWWRRATVGARRVVESWFLRERDEVSPLVSIRQHTSAYVSMRPHASAYVRIRQHTSAYVSIRQHTSVVGLKTFFFLC